MIRDVLNYRGWKVFMSYDMHMFLLALLYLLYIDNVRSVWSALLMILSFELYGLYGFLVNDYFDYESDVSSGKFRSVHRLGKGFVVVWIFLVLILEAIVLFYLGNTSFVLIYTISILLAFFYSAPPLRFKERGALGIFVNCLIEKTLVTLAIFTYFNHMGWDTLAFVFASFFLHLADIVTHQLYDYDADSMTSTKTFAVEKGLGFVTRIYRRFVCPMALFSTITLVLSIGSVTVISTALLVAIVYAIAYLMIREGRVERRESLVPLYVSASFFLVHNVLPVLFAFLLAFRYFEYSVLVPLVILSQYYTIKYKILMPVIHKVVPHVDIFN